MIEEGLQTPPGDEVSCRVRLDESLRLQRFFARLLDEVLHLGADTVSFTSDGVALSVVISQAKKSVKTTTLKSGWLAPMLAWLAERAVGDSAHRAAIDYSNPEINFSAALRNQDTITSFRVSGASMLSKKHTVQLTQFSTKTVKAHLADFDISSGQFEQVLASKNGLVVLADPVSRAGRGVLCAYLALSSAHYAGELENGLNFDGMAEFCGSHAVVVLTQARDAVEALLKLRQHGVDVTDCHLCGAVAQGMIKKVCSSCGRAAPVDAKVLASIPEALRPTGNYNYLVGRGCGQCGHTGYRGALLVQSIAVVTDEVRRALQAGADERALLSLLYPAGTRTLLEDGVAKCLSGRCTFESLFALTRTMPDSYLPFLKKRVVAELAPTALPGFDSEFFNGEAGEAQRPLTGRGAFTGNPTDSAPSDDPLFSPAKLRTSRAKPLLVIAEDDGDQRAILEMVLKSADYEVHLAGDGREGMKLVETKYPDLVITDLMMPNMDGSEFVSALKADARFRDIPVLVLTVMNDSEKEFKLLTIGADDYLEKTIQRKILLKRVENLIKRTKRG